MHSNQKLILLAFLLMDFHSIAQDGSKTINNGSGNAAVTVPAQDSVGQKKRSYKLELDYGNDRVQQGIKGTEMQPYLSPAFRYTAKSGFNTGLSSTYLFSTSAFDELAVDVGWDVKIHNDITGGTTLTKYFYNNNSPQARSSVTSNIELFLQNDFDIFESRLYFDVDFFSTKTKQKGNKKGGSSTGSDHSFTWDNYREFDFDSISKRGDAIILTPKILVTAGTQHVYENYYEKIQKKHPEFIPSAQDSSISNFAITSYEFVLPVEYDYRKFYAEASLHYVIPEHQPAILKLNNYFYFGISAGFDF